jgi:hypothetical protein
MFLKGTQDSLLARCARDNAVIEVIWSALWAWIPLSEQGSPISFDASDSQPAWRR